MGVEAATGAILTLIRQRLLWVFGAIAAASVAILFLPAPASADLIDFRNDYGAFVWVTCVVSVSLFTAGLVDLFVHSIASRPGRALRILARPEKSWWHRARQKDGRITTQIAVDATVFNGSSEPIHVVDVRLTWPLVRREKVRGFATLPEPGSHLHSHTAPALPGRTEAHLNLFVDKALGNPSKSLKVRIKIVDHSGRAYVVRVKLRSSNPEALKPRISSVSTTAPSPPSQSDRPIE